MFWSVNFPSIPVLNPVDSILDVGIIGGGITGLSTAYYLKDTNLKIALFDKGLIGQGVTSKTTAKITYLQGDIYQKLGTRAKEYYLSQKQAISELLRIIEKEHIFCDLEQVRSIVFTLEDGNVSKIKREKELLESFSARPFDVFDDSIKAGIGVSDTYVFHPLKYLSGLSRLLLSKILLYENTLVQNIKRENDYYLLQTTLGDFMVKNVVIACHYPFFLYPNFFPLKTYIQREYVNVANVKKHEAYSAINIDSCLHSIRYYKDYLIYGSNRHKLTSKIDYGKSYEKSRKDFKKYFHSSPEYTWMNQDIVSHDLLPFIGEVSPHLFLGTAYRGWGITNGTLAGKILSDLILHKRNEFSSLFSPCRMSVSLFANSFLGTFHYMKVYAEALWKKNNPTYIRINGVIYAIYEDKGHNIHKIRLLCPHMKCNLVFNSFDETWDCPCHGSRFDLDGKLIEGPAKENLKTSI